MTNPAPQRLRDALNYVTDYTADPAVLEAEASQIEALYGTPGRYYHTLDHAIDVAERAWRLAGGEYEYVRKRLVAAGLYHDVVYTPGADNNEERSADFAFGGLMDLSDNLSLADSVSGYIMVTKTHQPYNDTDKIIADADLWGLGANWYTYQTARRNVFRELGCDPHRNVVGSKLYQGRIEFLENMLGRTNIFHTARGIKEREPSARVNMSNELRFTKRMLGGRIE